MPEAKTANPGMHEPFTKVNTHKMSTKHNIPEMEGQYEDEIMIQEPRVEVDGIMEVALRYEVHILLLLEQSPGIFG